MLVHKPCERGCASNSFGVPQRQGVTSLWLGVANMVIINGQGGCSIVVSSAVMQWGLWLKSVLWRSGILQQTMLDNRFYCIINVELLLLSPPPLIVLCRSVSLWCWSCKLGRHCLMLTYGGVGVIVLVVCKSAGYPRLCCCD